MLRLPTGAGLGLGNLPMFIPRLLFLFSIQSFSLFHLTNLISFKIYIYNMSKIETLKLIIFIYILDVGRNIATIILSFFYNKKFKTKSKELHCYQQSLKNYPCHPMNKKAQNHHVLLKHQSFSPLKLTINIPFHQKIQQQPNFHQD